MLYLVAYILLATILVASARDAHVNPFKFKKLLDTSNCSYDYDVVLVVHSSIKKLYTRRRMAMRTTWLHPQMLQDKLDIKVKVVFFLGSSLDDTEQERIRYENELYRDIVQYSFIDHYHNNTYKVMAYLRWVADNCYNVSVLIKIDDDLLLDVKRTDLFKTLVWSWISRTDNFYAGTPLSRNPVRSPNGTLSKWYLSFDDYPMKRFPESYQGLIYALSPRMAEQLYRISLDTRFLFTDDVYVGILIKKYKRFMKVTRIPYENIAGLSWLPFFNTTDSILDREFFRHKHAVYHVPNLSYYWAWLCTNGQYWPP